MNFWLPPWAWTLLRRHLSGRRSRAAVIWMNAFAFLGIAIGVMAMTGVLSIMKGLQGDIKTRILNEKPHLLWEGRPNAEARALEPQIRKIVGSELKSLDFLLQSEALLEVKNVEQKGRISGAGVVVQGIENFGREVHAGIELLGLVGLAPGDSVRLHSVWKMELAPLDVKVSQAFETGVYEVDKAYIRMDQKKLESWLELPNAISRIEIKLLHPELAPEIQKKLKLPGGVEFKTWQETESSLWYSLRLENVMMSIAVFFVVLIAALALNMALSVRVAEKTREIGLLRGLGANDKFLARLYLTEGAVLGLLGSTFGLLMGWVLCKLLGQYWQLPSIYVSTRIAVDWNWPSNIMLAVGAVFLAVLASWLPARKVRSIEVQEALRS